MIVDLRSDTVTRPTAAMKDAMMRAQVGDDVFSDDPSVNELERKAAAMFNMQAALYCPSGTMTNQIAVKTHTQPTDEVIIEATNHVYYYEVGGIAYHSGASVRLIQGNRGRIKPDDIVNNINPNNLHHARTSLVCIENTCNRGGGSYYTINEMKQLSDTARNAGLKIHLDGARIFNALVELNEQPNQLGNLFDSISVCLSKGLGCPVGSLLLGNKEFILKARRFRKVFGGGMRQAGFLAAAGIYALDNHIERLKEDHIRAKRLGAAIENHSMVEKLFPVDTNILIFKLKDQFNADAFVEQLKAAQIICIAIGKNQIRMLTHLDVDDAQTDYVINTLKNITF